MRSISARTISLTAAMSTPVCLAMARTSTSAVRLVSKSRLARTSALVASRFWLIMTKVDRKIASRLTIIVSRPNGKSSNTSAEPTSPALSTIQTVNQPTCR